MYENTPRAERDKENRSPGFGERASAAGFEKSWLDAENNIRPCSIRKIMRRMNDLMPE